jgi:hypothetical protein
MPCQPTHTHQPVSRPGSDEDRGRARLRARRDSHSPLLELEESYARWWHGRPRLRVQPRTWRSRPGGRTAARSSAPADRPRSLAALASRGRSFRRSNRGHVTLSCEPRPGGPYARNAVVGCAVPFGRAVLCVLQQPADSPIWGIWSHRCTFRRPCPCRR